MSSKSEAEPSLRRRTWSLAGRFTAWYALVSFLLILAATAYLYWALVASLDREDDHFLADQALPLVNLLQEHADRKILRRQIELAWPARPDPNVYMRILDDRQQVIADTPSMGLTI